MPEWKEHLRPRLARLRLSPAREAEIIEEMSLHLEQRYEELRALGETDEDARRLALDELSEPDALERHMKPLRQARAPTPVTPGLSTGRLLGDIRQDLRYALRTFSRQSGFALAVVLTLALGIGATTAIFSVVYGVMLKPLPYDEPDRIVSLEHHGTGVDIPVMNQGPGTYFVYRENQRVFDDIGGWDRTDVSVTGRGDPERVAALAVTDGVLPILRVAPILGGMFTAEDDSPGAPLRVMLTHGYWQGRMGGDKSVIGQSLSIDGEPAEIIGVLPASFRFPRSDAAILFPLRLDPADANAVSFGFQGIARLRTGVTLEDANAEIGRMIELVEEKVPAYESFGLDPYVYPLVEYAIGTEVGRILWILVGTVGIILLIACANVANLFMVRAEVRQQELALRTALGARRWRLARALLSESLLLTVAAGIVGLALAAAGVALLRTMAPASLPRVEEIAVDPLVLGFTLATSIAIGLLFAVIPMAKVGAPTAAVLKEGGRTASETASRLRTRNVLVVAEVAMAFVLLITSGLMVRTFISLRQVEPGFEGAAEVQTFRVEIPDLVVDDPEQMVRVHEEIAGRLSQVPGVQSVGLSSSVTMDGEDNSNPLFVERDPPCDDASQTCWYFRRLKTVAPGYFATMGNDIVAGRDITWSDIYEIRPVIVVSAALAREFWGSPTAALGKRLRAFDSYNPWLEVVGVVGDERDDGLALPPTGIVYWPLLNAGYTQRNLAYSVRSERVGSPEFVRELQSAVWAVDPDLPLSDVSTLAQIEADSMAGTSFTLVMLAIAATIALVLGVVGIYGVVAYVAVQRTREIGIRMALGAQITDVRKIFFRYGLWLTGIGIVVGIAGALLLTRGMSALLFGVAPTDPVTYAAVAVVLTGVALLATDLPARRAARVDPVVALRAEG
jgi:putative ABC transport system permease protein